MAIRLKLNIGAILIFNLKFILFNPQPTIFNNNKQQERNNVEFFGLECPYVYILKCAFVVESGYYVCCI